MIKIGDKFRKQLNKKQFVNCEVFDIYEVVSTSQKTGKISNRLVYYAVSDNYALGDAFEVSKTTIIRGKYEWWFLLFSCIAL